MKGVCRACGGQVYVVTSDGLCPACRAAKKKASGQDLVESAEDRSEFAVVDRPAVPALLLSEQILFSELPKECPACRKPLGTARAPKRQLSKRAKLFILLGILISVATGVTVFVFMLYVAAASGITRIPVFVAGIYAIPFSFLVSIPAIVMAYMAMQMNKVVSMKCRECGWNAQFTIIKPR